jgi:hypothetical protein
MQELATQQQTEQGLNDWLWTDEAREERMRKLGSRRWRLDNLYWIVDRGANKIKFKMNLVQKILYLGLWFCNIVLKHRQPGVTTFFCILYLDDCLFNSNLHACIVAHRQDDAERIFNDKIHFAYKNLPQFIKDANPLTKEVTGKVLYFANGSSMRVTTSGRSGTYHRVHISEYGYMCAKNPKAAREVKTGTVRSVHPTAGGVISIESTSYGSGGDFHDMCKMAQDLEKQIANKQAVLSKMDYKFFFFPWFRNPENVINPHGIVIYDYQKEYFEQLEASLRIKLSAAQKAWYVKEWNVQGDDMKREDPSTPEEAFEIVLKGTYFANEFKLIRNEGRITRVPIQSGALVDTWWDLGYNDENVIWFTQDIGRNIHIVDFYRNSGEGLEHYRNILLQKKEKRRFEYGQHWAPHDVKKHEYQTGRTIIDAAKEMGIKFRVAPKLSILSGIEQMRQVLRICWFDEEATAEGTDRLERYRKEWNETLACYRDSPLHDENSNTADAFRTLAVAHKFKEAVPMGETYSSKEKPSARGWT